PRSAVYGSSSAQRRRPQRGDEPLFRRGAFGTAPWRAFRRTPSLLNARDSGRGNTGAEPPCIDVAHCPPRGTLDRTSLGIRAGSKAAAAVVERLRPRLVLCGHVHEARGVLEREGTLYVNAGPGKRLCSALVEGD